MHACLHVHADIKDVEMTHHVTQNHWYLLSSIFEDLLEPFNDGQVVS